MRTLAYSVLILLVAGLVQTALVNSTLAQTVTAVMAFGPPPQANYAQTVGTAPASDQPLDLASYYECGPAEPTCGTGWFDELTLFGGIDGSKQPQDFGVNANLGGQFNANWGIPVSQQLGIGVQLGQAVVGSDNAVQVFERVGEAKDRFQSYTTLGMFQRTASGFAWGFAYDWLNEDSYDTFSLQQWRMRAAYDLGPCDQVGMTVNLRGGDDTGNFNATAVRLQSIDQGHFFWRHWWESGTQTTAWAGIAEGHSEANAALGDLPRYGESFLMGADILAPLNNYLAIYGETNLIFPADTGTVDAFLGIQFSPGGRAKRSRRGRFSPLLPVASPTSFSTDLMRQ